LLFTLLMSALTKAISSLLLHFGLLLFLFPCYSYLIFLTLVLLSLL
jgi:hypothetical protein